MVAFSSGSFSTFMIRGLRLGTKNLPPQKTRLNNCCTFKPFGRKLRTTVWASEYRSRTFLRPKERHGSATSWKTILRFLENNTMPRQGRWRVDASFGPWRMLIQTRLLRLQFSHISSFQRPAEYPTQASSYSISTRTTLHYRFSTSCSPIDK